MIDEESTQRRGVGHVVGQDLVYLALVVKLVTSEAFRQFGQCGHPVGPARRQRGQTAVAEERAANMDPGISPSGHRRKDRRMPRREGAATWPGRTR